MYNVKCYIRILSTIHKFYDLLAQVKNEAKYVNHFCNGQILIFQF